MRIATFNLENLDDGPDVKPALADRIQTVAPQLRRLRVDIQRLQEVHIESGWRSIFISLDELFEQSWQLIQASQQFLARPLAAIGN